MNEWIMYTCQMTSAHLRRHLYHLKTIDKIRAISLGSGALGIGDVIFIELEE